MQKSEELEATDKKKHWRAARSPKHSVKQPYSSTNSNETSPVLSNYSTVSLGPLQRQQLFQEFFAVYLTKTKSEPGYRPPWLLLYPDRTQPSTVLEISTAGLWVACLGREKNDGNLLSQSLRLYTYGLSELQKAIADPDLVYTDETLAAAAALSMYELIECPNEERLGHTSHVRGMAKLVRLRGESAYTSQLARQVFRIFRVVEVCLVPRAEFDTSAAQLTVSRRYMLSRTTVSHSWPSRPGSKSPGVSVRRKHDSTK